MENKKIFGKMCGVCYKFFYYCEHFYDQIQFLNLSGICNQNEKIVFFCHNCEMKEEMNYYGDYNYYYHGDDNDDDPLPEQKNFNSPEINNDNDDPISE